MIEIGNRLSSPIEVWEHWPIGKLQKGDIVRVSWSYDGVHGPVYSEDTYLLIERISKDESHESWRTMVFGNSSNNGKVKNYDFHEHTIYSDDFQNDAPGDWQRVALMVRAEDRT